MGGRETFAALKAINPGIRAIVSSGFSIDGDAHGILDDGAQAFLQKPFNQAELSRTVADLLGATVA